MNQAPSEETKAKMQEAEVRIMFFPYTLTPLHPYTLM
jgi:hypothetical protein